MMRRGMSLMLLAMSACAGPRPAAPETAAVTPPDAWRSNPGNGAPVSADWWSGFGDPALTRVVEEALSNNVDLSVAASRVEEARAQFRLARGAQLPSLSASVAGAEQRAVSAFGVGTDQIQGQALLSASYDLDLFGRLANATAAARASLLATQAARDGVRLAVAASAASGYLGLRALDARLALLRDTLAARSDSLRIARRRADVGYAPMLELRQAEAEYRATEQLIPAAELAIRRQEDGLSLLLGANPRAIERGLALEAIASPAVPGDLPADVLRRRPDIAQAEQQVVAADRSLDSARAAFMPGVSLTASGGAVASSLLGDPISIFSLGGSVLAPVFQGGRLQAQADVAAARRDQAALGYRKAALTAFREVEDALAALIRNEEQERALDAQRAALAQALVLATNRYDAGYSSYLEKLDAQRALLGAELSLVQTRADRLAAAVALYQALGGGWGG